MKTLVDIEPKLAKKLKKKRELKEYSSKISEITQEKRKPCPCSKKK